MKHLAAPARSILGRAGAYWLYESQQRLLGYSEAKALFEQTMGSRLDLSNPVTINEKLTWLKLHDKNPLLPVITDKARVRDWIAQRVGEDVLIPLVRTFDSAAAIVKRDVPNRFIAKINSGSGRNILVWDKESIDWAATMATLEGWLRETQMYKLMEWYHHQSPPRIVMEHLLVGPDGEVASDYKFFVFDGRVEMLYHVQHRFSNQTRTCYTPEWELLPLLIEGRPNEATPPPPQLERMVEIAGFLGGGFPFLRVDMYCHEGRVYVGELTPHPNSGRCRFVPSSYDLELGKQLDLDRFRGRYWDRQ